MPSNNEVAPFKPKLRELLGTLGVDVAFHRAEGTRVYFKGEGGREQSALDFVGGYGSLLFGHNHPELVAEARRILDAGLPFQAQGSLRPYAEKLAAELSRRAGGGYRAVFANSGTEAIEAAMKHAMLETGSRRFIALDRAFHGKTLGSLQLAGHEGHRPAPLRIPDIEVRRVAPDDIPSLEAAFNETGDVAGFIYEPVIGEGGVVPLSAEFLQRAAALCRDRDIPLIADECQTGFGRTGSLVASHRSHISPDYLIFSKALGGGIAKISALLIRESRFQEDFDFLHTSTYADDDFSCAIALKALELLDEKTLTRIQERGSTIRASLERIAKSHPASVAEVRGVGLMLGLELRPQTFSDSFVLRYLSQSGDLAYLVTGYLFHAHRIRVAPTLGNSATLRLSPPATVTDSEISHLLDALDDVCAKLAAGDALSLTRFLTAEGPTFPRYLRSDVKTCTFRSSPRIVPHRDSPPKHIGWLCHLIGADDFCHLDPSFGALSTVGREQMLERWIPRANPVILNSAEVRSAAGEAVQVDAVLLPFTSAWAKRQLDSGDLHLARALVARGVSVARAAGASVVALGQYTSILTADGTTLEAECGITTGNTYAVALAVEALRRAIGERGIEPRNSTLVVAGAGGNIGRTCTEILAPEFEKVILVGSGRRGSLRRLEQFASAFPNTTTTEGPGALKEADIAVLALNAAAPPFGPSQFKPGAIVCDLSVPAGLPESFAAARPDILLIHGGIANLPGGEDLGIVGFPLPAGQTYGCMAEGILLGLEEIHDHTFTGPVTTENVTRIAEIAHRHGFALAEFKTESVFGTAFQQ